MQWIDYLSIFHLLSLLYFYVLLLFNASLFLDVCGDEIRGRNFQHWLKNIFHDYATRKGMVKLHVNKSFQYMKLIGNQSLFHMIFLLWCCIYLPVWQFMTVPSVQNFATYQNWLFVAEVCNTVWCGQIKNRIIWTR